MAGGPFEAKEARSPVKSNSRHGENPILGEDRQSEALGRAKNVTTTLALGFVVPVSSSWFSFVPLGRILWPDIVFEAKESAAEKEDIARFSVLLSRLGNCVGDVFCKLDENDCTGVGWGQKGEDDVCDLYRIHAQQFPLRLYLLGELDREWA